MDYAVPFCHCGVKFSNKTELFCTGCGQKRTIYKDLTEEQAEGFKELEAMKLAPEPEVEDEVEPEVFDDEEEIDEEPFDDYADIWAECERSHQSAQPSIGPSAAAGFFGGLIAGALANRNSAMPTVIFLDGTPVTSVTESAWGRYTAHFGNKGEFYLNFNKGEGSGYKNGRAYNIVWPN